MKKELKAGRVDDIVARAKQEKKKFCLVRSLRALFFCVFHLLVQEERLKRTGKGQRPRSTIYSLLYQRIIVKQNDELEQQNSSRFRRRPFHFLAEFRFIVFPSPEFTL